MIEPRATDSFSPARGTVPAEGTVPPEGTTPAGTAAAAAGTVPERGAAPERRQITVRRAPKFAVFLMLGALLGFLVAVAFALTGPESAEHTRISVLGFFTMLLVLPGLAVGGLTALLFDRASIRQAQRATVEAVDGADDDNPRGRAS